MRSLTIKGRLDRHSLRGLIRSGYSMDDVDRMERVGVITPEVRDRYERLWAWSTATAHPLIDNASLERWRARRDRIIRAIRNMPYPPRAA